MLLIANLVIKICPINNIAIKLQNMTAPLPSMVGGVERAEFLLGIALPPDIKQGGNFTCIATNEVGTAVRTVEVIVQSKCYYDVMMISLLPRLDLCIDRCA